MPQTLNRRWPQPHRDAGFRRFSSPYLGRVFLRNILPDGTLQDYMRDIPGRLAVGFRPQDVYVSTYLSALGAINAGVTTLLDWSQIQNSPGPYRQRGQRLAGRRDTRRVRLWAAEPRPPLVVGRIACLSRRHREIARDEICFRRSVADARRCCDRSGIRAVRNGRKGLARGAQCRGADQRARRHWRARQARSLRAHGARRIAWPRHDLYPLRNLERDRMGDDCRYRRHDFDLASDRDADGPWHAADPNGH